MKYRTREAACGFEIVFAIDGNTLRVVAVRPSRMAAEQTADDMNRFARLILGEAPSREMRQ